jgi:hypothetical protein
MMLMALVPHASDGRTTYQDDDSIGPTSEVGDPTGGSVRAQGKRVAQKRTNTKGRTKVVATGKKFDKKKLSKISTDLRKAAFGSRKITEYFNCSG